MQYVLSEFLLTHVDFTQLDGGGSDHNSIY